MIEYNSKEKFRVERGYLNRTRIYLYPAIVLLKSYREFMQELKENMLCVSYENDSVVIYYDRKNTVAIKKLLEVLKANDEYLDDYLYNENSYAIRVKLDQNFAAFEERSYSDIYRADQINKVFTKDSKTRKVLTKDPDYKQTYVDLLNQWFKTNHSIEDLELQLDGRILRIKQYDIPPCFNKEILDYDSGREIIKGGTIKKTEHY